MGRKPVERTIYMETLELIQKMREELDALEKKVGTIKTHIREERFENLSFSGIGRVEEYVLGKGIRLREDGQIEGKEMDIWKYLASLGPQALKKNEVGL